MMFHDNAALCAEVTERVVQHFTRCIESHGRHMQYLKFLQTIVKSENTYIRKCQDMVMSEVTCTAFNARVWCCVMFCLQKMQLILDQFGKVSQLNVQNDELLYGYWTIDKKSPHLAGFLQILYHNTEIEATVNYAEKF